jgi:hypothetical protein
MSLLRALIDASVVARDALKSQLKGLKVEGDFAPGCDICEMKLEPAGGDEAPEANGNPVTAVGKDIDDVTLAVQLLVSAGRLAEVAIFKGDGSQIQKMPVSNALRFYDTHVFREGQVQSLERPGNPGH